MGAFTNYDEFADDSITLPVGDKAYTIPGVDAQLGLWCQRLMSVALQVQQGQQPQPIPPLPALPDDPNQNPITADGNGNVEDDQRLYRRVLGPVWDQLLADGQSWPKIQLISQTAIFWIGSGLEMAQRFWESGGNPEAVAPSRKARRSTATAGASTTQKPSSGSGTKSRRTNTKR